MEIIHNLGKNSINKTVDSMDSRSLMLAEGGSYLWISGQPSSRYQGWFFESGHGLVKIIDDIMIKDAGPVTRFENSVWGVKRAGADFAQTFFFADADCLVCETDSVAEMEFYFDVKEPYENPEYGRSYKVWREDGMIFVNYKQDGQFLMPELYLAICGDIADVAVNEEWVKQEYELDRKRGSHPWERWVCKPLAVTASKILIVAGESKEKAQANAQRYWTDFEKIKAGKIRKCATAKSIFILPGKGDAEAAAAKRSTAHALSMLVAPAGPVRGLRAGLPWFFQFWPRDEAVSLGGLLKIDADLAETIFWRQLGELKAHDFDFKTADGIGWLFFSVFDFISKARFDMEEIAAIQNCLEAVLDKLLEYRTKKGLAICGKEPTWMDSLDRSGAGIEIQALRLSMYSLAAHLAADTRQKDRYSNLEKDLAVAVRLGFFDRGRLADRLDANTGVADFTARPNIFLAAYVYPDLLEKQEWIKCFESALARLWLDWGGLSTIDKGDPRFCGRDTGEDAAAYHNGDSWFWVNNIAAIVMTRFDRKRFQGYIEKIYEASKNDILWNGAISCASEISSANNYEPSGCPNQAWSNATFLELCVVLKK